MRMIDPPEVQGWTVVVLGGVTLAVDALTAWLTYSMQKGSMNIRAFFLHNLSDALASVAVIAGGTLIILYDMWWVDPAVTIVIALYILRRAFAEIGDPIRALMLGSPSGIDREALVSTLCAVPGVAGVHHLHLWQMQEHAAALDMHVVVEVVAWGRVEQIKGTIKRLLRDEFAITHSTLEFEREDQAHRGAALFGDGEDGSSSSAN